MTQHNKALTRVMPPKTMINGFHNLKISFQLKNAITFVKMFCTFFFKKQKD